ncbi:MAG: response regulator [bacterium]
MFFVVLLKEPVGNHGISHHGIVYLPVFAMFAILPGAIKMGENGMMLTIFDSAVRIYAMKVLIVEDDADSRHLFEVIVANAGYEPVLTGDGPGALEIIGKPDAPQIALLDWNMPDMSGVEVCRKIREIQTDNPTYIIMITGRAGTENIIQGLQAGANDYFIKPCNVEELQARLGVGRRVVTMQDKLNEQVRELHCAQDALSQSLLDMRALTARMNVVREEERARLAREMHDEFGQQLTALHLDLMWADRNLQTADKALLQDRLANMVPLVESLTELTQTIGTALRPSALDDLGLAAAIEWLLEETEKRTGITCKTTLAASDEMIGHYLALPLFRITQEAVANVARHAQATSMEVSLLTTGNIWTLEVKDNGRGYMLDANSWSKNLGLLGMRERAAEFGGTVEFLSEPGKGASVLVRIPCDISNTGNGVRP